MRGVIPFVGMPVHVEGAEGVCSPAIVLDVIDPEAETLRLRVFYRAPVTEPVGARDAESVYPPAWAETSYTNPDGTTRKADSWHWPYHNDR